MSTETKKTRLLERAKESLRAALTIANDVRVERGTYACHIWAVRPPAICFEEDLELETVAYVSLLEGRVHLMPGIEIEHDELVFGLAECGWDILEADGGRR